MDHLRVRNVLALLAGSANVLLMWPCAILSIYADMVFRTSRLLLFGGILMLLVSVLNLSQVIRSSRSHRPGLGRRLLIILNTLVLLPALVLIAWVVAVAPTRPSDAVIYLPLVVVPTLSIAALHFPRLSVDIDRCSSCGYDLRGLRWPRLRCPECGSTIL